MEFGQISSRKRGRLSINCSYGEADFIDATTGFHEESRRTTHGFETPFELASFCPASDRTRFRRRHIAGLLGTSQSARAADGCLVRLCFAAPSWSLIAQCVPPIRSVLGDFARGRAFPTCGMSCAGNTANNGRSSTPDCCPPQYTTAIEMESDTRYQYRYDGAVSGTIDGVLWAPTWSNLSGETVTEFTPAAKAALGS